MSDEMPEHWSECTIDTTIKDEKLDVEPAQLKFYNATAVPIRNYVKFGEYFVGLSWGLIPDQDADYASDEEKAQGNLILKTHYL